MRRAPILVAFSLYAVSFGLIVPAFPALLNQFTEDNVELSSLYFGTGLTCRLTSLPSLTCPANFIKHGLEFFSTPILGTLSDTFGRRPVLLFALFVVSLEAFLIALFPSVSAMMCAKVLAGLGEGDCTS